MYPPFAFGLSLVQSFAFSFFLMDLLLFRPFHLLSQAGVELDGDLLGHEGQDAAWAAGVETPEEHNNHSAAEGASSGGDGGGGDGGAMVAVSPWQAKQNALR